MKQDTKTHILDVGAQIVRRKGFNATGIQEILEGAGIPKGSFYFYFKSKDDFGLQLIDHYAHFLFSKMDRFLNAQEVDPIERLQNYFEWFLEFFEQNDFIGGCPIGNLSQEMSDLNDTFREKLQNVLEEMKQRLTQCLHSAQQQKKLSPSLDIQKVADFMVSGWQGALLQMKVTKSTTPIRNFEKIIFGAVLKS